MGAGEAPAGLDVRYRVGGGPEVEARAAHLGEKGVFIHAEAPPAVDAALAGRLALPDGSTLVFAGRVVYSNPHRPFVKSALPPGMGIVFLDLGAEDLERVKAAAQEEAGTLLEIEDRPPRTDRVSGAAARGRRRAGGGERFRSWVRSRFAEKETEDVPGRGGAPVPVEPVAADGSWPAGGAAAPGHPSPGSYSRPGGEVERIDARGGELPGAMRIEDITVGVLRQAVSLYLDRAYPEGDVGPDVFGRLGGMEGTSVSTLVEAGVFEESRSKDLRADRYLLRLGCSHYPHVKLALERCSGGEQFIFAVETHDHHFVFPDDLAPETRERFARIQDQNRRLKTEVEADWSRAGLPTFRRFIEAGLAAGR